MSFNEYINYHRIIPKTRDLIAGQQYQDALVRYKQLFEEYDSIVVPEYNVATQRGFYLGRNKEAID